jgi:type I restriction enzyme, S subunit
MSKDWIEVTLGDIARPIARPMPVVPGMSYRTIGVKWWGEGAYERETIDGSGTAARTLSVVHEGDLIINKIWVRHGSTAIATKAVDGCVASGEFPTFELDRERVLPQWIHWQTKMRGFWSKCSALSMGTSGKNRITPERFLTIRVPLPPLPEQRRLVARIEEVATKIAEARLLRHEAASGAGALLSAAQSGAYRTALRIGGKPERLEDLCTRVTDGTHITPHYVEEGVPFISVKDITGGRIRLDSSRRISREEHARLTKRCQPEQGDILLTKIGTIGLAMVVDIDEEFSIFVSLALLKLKKDRVLPKFIEHMLNSTIIRDQALADTRGVGNKNLVLKFIREFSIPTPPLPVQRRIVAELDEVKAKLDAVRAIQEETAVKLDAFLPSVLSKAVVGEL